MDVISFQTKSELLFQVIALFMLISPKLGIITFCLPPFMTPSVNLNRTYFFFKYSIFFSWDWRNPRWLILVPVSYAGEV
jgi:hypothetical protein